MTGGQVVQLLPRWPRVRCDRCRRVYDLTPAQLALRPVQGGCPRCGYARFSTTMDRTPAA